jgi:rhodanese-related sulfurtransferase
MINRPVWLLAVSLVMASLIAPVAIAQDSISRMTKEELKARLDDSSLVIVDARSSRNWDASDRKIKGAVRVEPRDASKLPEAYSKDQTLVFYCA